MDMDVPLLQTHRDAATALYLQRTGWRGMPGIAAGALARLEQRLRLHLHVLARVPPETETEPDRLEAAFVALAADFQSPDGERRTSAAARATEWLGNDADHLREAAREALALHPGEETVAETRRAWEALPELRATLVDIWRIQGTDVPRGLLNQGELHAHDIVLQAAVLRYCADWPEAGLSVFQPYYQALIGDPFGSHAEHVLLAEALRGGLLRGDADAVTALRRAIELQASTEEALPLLRLAALSGEADFHPVLQQHARSEPASGYRLLALWGRREAAEDLLEGLASPRDNEHAAVAWRLLTGQRLPVRPRMQVVGEEAPEAGEPIADVDTARAWWQREREAWPPEQRRLHGRPLCGETLLAWLEADAGQASTEALDLLGMLAARPTGIAPETWQLQRRQALAAFPLPESVTEQAAHA